MLGHVVTRYLAQQGCQVLTSAQRYAAQARDPLVETARDSGCAWIVNCIGRIKQKSDNPAELFLANSLFPIHLGLRLRPDQRLVHASTDCVFSGRQGHYPVNGEQDAEDIYGLSKAIGEAAACPRRCVVIRTSIIGPELSGDHGLMGWFLSQSGEVNGYTNHLWNGITTLEWAKICVELMSGRLKIKDTVVQPGTEPPMCKCDMLRLLGQIWGSTVKVRPVKARDAVDRTLVPTLTRPGLEQQLRELKTWYDPGQSAGAPPRAGATPAVHTHASNL
jgi:dTDP-4-dehydrorhamnose reductase